MYNARSFTPKNQTPLTIEEIAQRAPSALATKPYDAMSAKYTYVPTLGVLEAADVEAKMVAVEYDEAEVQAAEARKDFDAVDVPEVTPTLEMDDDSSESYESLAAN